MANTKTIHLRVKQRHSTKANDENVKIFAPTWVEQALKKLSPEFKNARFEIEPPSKKYWTVKDKLTLIDLVALARNERANTSGIINFSLYQGIKKEAVIALRDLAKHCVIVGNDTATHFGGYPAGTDPTPLNQEVTICDLPGLQFQELNNTGRHVLLSPKDNLPKGMLDKEIFKNTVGEDKATFQQAKQDKTGRYLKGSFKNKAVLFDIKAFQRFVSQDFVLAGLALNKQAKLAQRPEKLNFKFLKYGAGFFAANLEGIAKEKLNENLTLAVYEGIKQFFNLPLAMRSQIKRIELPFFRDADNPQIDKILNKIAKLCKENKIEFASTNDDALAPTSTKFKTATTNCSDPHAPTGNEMNYGSVDAAIAENLKKKGNNFSPICNRKMQQEFLATSSYQPFNYYALAGTVLLSMVVGGLIYANFALATLPILAIMGATFVTMMGLQTLWQNNKPQMLIKERFAPGDNIYDMKPAKELLFAHRNQQTQKVCPEIMEENKAKKAIRLV